MCDKEELKVQTTEKSQNKGPVQNEIQLQGTELDVEEEKDKEKG